MAVFGLKYYAEMRSKYQGITWRCDIAQRGYTGPSEEMTFSGVSPIKITWERRGDDFYTPVKASEASINILSNIDFKDILGMGTTGKKSVSSLLSTCISVLELCLAPFGAQIFQSGVSLRAVSSLVLQSAGLGN